jgi:hypothetical protein
LFTSDYHEKSLEACSADVEHQQYLWNTLFFKLTWKITWDMLCSCAAMGIEHHQYLFNT